VILTSVGAGPTKFAVNWPSLRSPLPSKRRELGSRKAGCGIRRSRRQPGQISSGPESALNMRASQDFDLSSVRDR
jgi:hypothetical protein